MSTKKPERWPTEQWRAAAPTVASMIEQGWDVIARCRTCGLATRVDLRVVAIVRGAKADMWNQTGRCKKLGCAGTVDFEGRPPQLYRHFRLAAEWPPGFIGLRD